MNPFETAAALGVIPVIAIESVEDALPLADALLEGGLPLAEITFRTAAAADVIDRLAELRPELLVGAGTVLNPDAIKASVAAGAKFALAPGFDAEVVAAAVAAGLPFAPGIMTPSDISAAVRQDVRLAKFFPAGAAGGLAMLEAVAAPFAHVGLHFIPTGGVTLATMGEWLASPLIAAVGGTWIAKKEDIRERRWAQITTNAAAAVRRAAEIRGAA
jgi:2-dehydro-3-deoxyphosphogluconate aldolase/(4S)-4-hydroxy-2-oxoglutarate aldolase